MQKKNRKNNDKKFKRHFRIYFVNNHPAYIVGENGEMYLFHRTTEARTSGGKKNWHLRPNPLKKDKGRKLYVVRVEQSDNKGRFSPFELEIKENVDISYPHIKLKKDLKK